jgi:superfamily II DNA or RNA helicase
MAKAFEKAGVQAEALDGGTPLEIRREILRRFHRGETQVVANCAVLTEGFDEPAVDCIVVARPTRSRPLYVQMIGRGTRPYPGKDDCLVLDLVGATARHDLMTAASLFRLPAHAIANVGVAEAAAHAEETERRRLDHEELVARTVDLFRGRPLHWVSAGPGRFVLALGDGMLVLTQTGERWRALVKRRDDVEILASDLPLDYAQGTAEDYARKVGARALVDPQAAWRVAPATDRQLAALRRSRIRARAGLTRGEASDLLSAAFAGATR